MLLALKFEGVFINESNDDDFTVFWSGESEAWLSIPLDITVAPAATNIFDGPCSTLWDIESFSLVEVLVFLVRPGSPKFALVVELLVLSGLGFSSGFHKCPFFAMLLALKFDGIFINESNDDDFTIFWSGESEAWSSIPLDFAVAPAVTNIFDGPC